jgi:hypothetical protein
MSSLNVNFIAPPVLSAANLVKQKENKEKEKDIILTRCGYEVAEAFNAFKTALTESGTQAIGKALHFGADIVCSGGIDLFKKIVWDFAIFHIGLASPRIFVYLKKRFSELDALIKKYPTEMLYGNEEFQTRISEIIYVLQGCPRRAAVKWPAVGADSHIEGWIRTVRQAPDAGAVLRTFKSESDMYPMKIAANEIVKACLDGNTEKSLFWVRWLLDEDAKIRKEHQGVGLTTLERGPATFSQKKRTDQGFFLLAVFAEMYKDLAAKNLVRMHEEFQCLIDIWRSVEIPLTTKQRREILGLFVHLLAEVPRWKVPAAPSLVKDATQLSRAVAQSYRFYGEVLVHPPIPPNALKGPIKTQKKSTKIITESMKKQLQFQEHMAAYDEVLNSFMGLS